MGNMKGQGRRGGVATRYWAMLIFVVIFWGIDPLINAYFYSYYSASVLSTVLTLSAAQERKSRRARKA